MSTGPGQPAPIIPHVCEHIVADGHVNQPLALLAFDHDLAFYVCPRCLADEAELLVDTLSPSEIGAAISFSHCDHVTDRGRRSTRSHCHTCEVAGTSALAQKWAELTFSKPTKANRLGKLLRFLGHKFDRAGLRAIDATQDSSPAPVASVYSKRMLRSESLNGDRARSALRWEEGKVQRQRTLRPPARHVAVVPPAQESAFA